MVVSAEGPFVYRMTAAGDQIAEALFLTKMVWTGVAASVFGTDQIQVVDPTNVANILWETTSNGPSTEKWFETADQRGHYAAHGIRLQVLTGNRGVLDIYVK